MEKATRRIKKFVVDYPIRWVTVHTAAGQKALESCVKATRCSSLKVVGVTVLTSEPVCNDEVFITRVTDATMAGVSHFVCSPREAHIIRSIHPSPTVITPGISMDGGARDDQKRVATPRHAIANGADYIVVGRPIRDADDPQKTIALINGEVERGLIDRMENR